MIKTHHTIQHSNSESRETHGIRGSLARSQVILLPSLFLPTLALILSAPLCQAEEKQPLREKLEFFLSDHCYECHDDLTDEGDLNLLDLEFDPQDPGNFEIWRTVHDMVAHGDMPPKKEPRPESALKLEFLATVKKPLIDIDRETHKMFGRVQNRRLTRREYEHTVHDLLGIDMPLKTLLPEDPASHGFETVAEGQQLSHFNLAAYLTAADVALHAAFERIEKGDQKFKRTYTPKDLARKGSGNYRGPDLRGNRSIAWPLGLQFFGRMPATEVPASGWYQVTLKNVEAVNPINGVVWGTLRSGECASNAPMMYPVGIIEATAKKRDIVFQAWIHDDHNLELKPNDVTLKRPSSGASGGNVSFKGRDLEKQGYSGIAVTGIEIERIYPNATRDEIWTNLFGNLTREQLKTGASKDSMRKAIKHFASRAFRRPLTDQQLAPWIELATAERSKPGNGPLDGLHEAYRGILCSPRFLTFVEAPGKLDDHALANRLSYMVWNSMPDAKLRANADAGKLVADPKLLHAELKRLLDDPKASRFIESFTDQWLNLKDMDFTTPDRRLYRTFDAIVQDAMVEETRHFVEHLILRNGNIRNIILANHSFLNERLARFYGMKDIALVPGNGVQKVTLPESHPGGLVTQAAIMKVTANGTTTSPVVRGVFVNERILGRHIPPPPPGVPAVEPDIRGAVSIRDQLAKHSNDETCAACHAKIDPSGFALESFDPVGRWRIAYGDASKKAAKIDPSGITPDGKSFEAIWDWKAIYAKQPDRLTKAFAQHLLTYATGAPPQFSDQGDLLQVVKHAKENNYGTRSIVHAVVSTEAFRTK